MSRSEVDALIIGAGVCGLTTAIRLAQAGLRLRVWSAEPPLSTTSCASGAMWGPYRVEPVNRVRVWSTLTLEVLLGLAADAETGVRLGSGIEASRVPVDQPHWGDQLERFRMCDGSELPDGFITGWRFTAPLVDMPVYLGYLERRLADAGVGIESRRIESFDEAAGIAPVVVNCAGMGARDLVPDPDLTPVRGQLVVVENPGITEFFLEDTGLAPELVHFYPHGDTLVLGGTAQRGGWSRDPDPDVAAAIVARCAEIEPRLRGARVLDHRVGLRPSRPYVRVEERQLDGVRLIHNYGHGGAGITISWGCAAEVAELLGHV